MNIMGPAALSLHLRSARACFRRPEFGSDFVSYDVLPPLHARRLLQSVLTDPDDFMVVRIHVLAPIAWIWSIVETASGTRRVLALREPEYRLDLRPLSGADTEIPSLLPNAVPHLGLKDFPAAASLVPESTDIRSEGVPVDLGWLPVELSSEQPRRTMYRRLSIRDGIIDLMDQDEAIWAS